MKQGLRRDCFTDMSEFSLEEISFEQMNLSRDLRLAIDMASRAGEITLSYFRSYNIEVDYKADGFGPVTVADKASDEYIRSVIYEQNPVAQILSEEDPQVPDNYNDTVWIFDPLDGTKQFVKGKEYFCVIIAKYENRKLQLGVVHAPALGVTYFAEAGTGAYRMTRDGLVTRLQVSQCDSLAEATLVLGKTASRGELSELEMQANSLQVEKVISIGSIGLRICAVAEGAADVFMHTSFKAGKWDTAGAQLILEEAGGVIRDLDGHELDYEKYGSQWEKSFVASANISLVNQVLDTR